MDGESDVGERDGWRGETKREREMEERMKGPQTSNNGCSQNLTNCGELLEA
jgi:hypothetical protein